MTRIMEPITGHSDIVEPSRIKPVTVILYIFLIALAVDLCGSAVMDVKCFIKR